MCIRDRIYLLQNDSVIATFADEPTLLITDINPERASEKLQRHLSEHLFLLQDCLKQGKIQVNSKITPKHSL